MEKDKIHIDHLYREREENSFQLPDNAWQAMAKRLDTPVKVVKVKGKWLWPGVVTSAAAAVMYVAGGNFHEAKQTKKHYSITRAASTPDSSKQSAALITPNAIVNGQQAENNSGPSASNTNESTHPSAHEQANNLKNTSSVTAAPKTGSRNMATRKPDWKNEKTAGITPSNSSTVQTEKSTGTGRTPETEQAAPTQEISTVLNSHKADSAVADKPEKKIIPAAIKQTKDSIVSAVNKAMRLKIGFKAGWETNVRKESFNKVVGGTYLQYRISDNYFLAISPALKYGNAAIYMPPVESYYNRTGTTMNILAILKSGKPYWHFTYKQYYDSIIASHTANKKSLELEIPLMVERRLGKRVFVQCGPVVSVGRLVSVSEQLATVPQYEEANFYVEIIGDHGLPDTSQSFHHSAAPFSSHKPKESPAANPIKIGYMAGISYRYLHWNLDLLLQQNVSALNEITLPDIKSMYNAPYTRIQLGYILGK